MTQELQKIGPEYYDRTPLRLEIESKKGTLRLNRDSKEAQEFLKRAEDAKDLAALSELTFYGIQGAYDAQSIIYKARDTLVKGMIESFAIENNLDCEFVRKSVTERSGPCSYLYLA